VRTRTTSPRADLDAVRRRLQLGRRDGVAGIEGAAERPGNVEQHAAGEQRLDRVHAQRREAVRRLDRRVDAHAAVHRQVLRLVAQRVDVRA
jgi:hypothetical protein